LWGTELGSVYTRARSPYFWWKFKDHLGRRIQISSGIPIGDGEDYARAALAEVEQACQRVRKRDLIAARILFKYGLITKEYVEKLAGNKTGEPEAAPIMGAALLHRSSRKEEQNNPRDYHRHIRELREFIVWSGVTDLRKLTRQKIEEYIEWLETVGPEPALKPNGKPFPRKPCKPDGIRHRLIMLRRACAIGATDFQLGNPFSAIRLEWEERGTPKAYDLARVLAILNANRYRPREFVALSLMACCGLRPSECWRIRCGDARKGVIHIAGAALDADEDNEHGDGEEQRKAKTKSSRRAIPLPGFLVPEIAKLKKGLKGHHALFRSDHAGFSGEPFSTNSAFGRSMTKAIRAAKVAPKLQAKHLRKSFLNISIFELKLPSQLVEAYMGRAIPGITKVSAHHYLKLNVETFRPISEAWNRAVLKALES
jgi:integrase